VNERKQALNGRIPVSRGSQTKAWNEPKGLICYFSSSMSALRSVKCAGDPVLLQAPPCLPSSTYTFILEWSISFAWVTDSSSFEHSATWSHVKQACRVRQQHKPSRANGDAGLSDDAVRRKLSDMFEQVSASTLWQYGVRDSTCTTTRPAPAQAMAMQIELKAVAFAKG
jgi:hypothetical protein